MEPRNHSASTSAMVLLVQFALWCILTGLGNPVNPSTSCSGCGRSVSNAPVTPSSYSPGSSRGILSAAEREFRTNLVKLKILKALNLVEPPNVSTPLPEIPYNFEEMSFEEEKEAKMSKPSPFFLVGRKVSEGCLQNPESVCYRFQKEGRTACGIKSEKLWVFMQNSNNSGNDLLIFENHTNGSVQRIAKLDSHLSGWVSVDLHPGYRVVSFSYDRSSADDINQLASIFEAHIPLIEVNMEGCSTHDQRRTRRTITDECSSADDRQCCLQEFTVDFSAIGWNWVLRPETIQANYCRGSCDFRILSPYATNHRTMMYRSYQRYAENDMLPCCVAVEKTHLQLLVYLNNTVSTRRYTGMSASACECY